MDFPLSLYGASARPAAPSPLQLLLLQKDLERKAALNSLNQKVAAAWALQKISSCTQPDLGSRDPKSWLGAQAQAEQKSNPDALIALLSKPKSSCHAQNLHEKDTRPQSVETSTWGKSSVHSCVSADSPTPEERAKDSCSTHEDSREPSSLTSTLDEMEAVLHSLQASSADPQLAKLDQLLAQAQNFAQGATSKLSKEAPTDESILVNTVAQQVHGKPAEKEALFEDSSSESPEKSASGESHEEGVTTDDRLCKVSASSKRIQKAERPERVADKGDYLLIHKFNPTTKRMNQVLQCKLCPLHFPKLCNLRDHLRIHRDEMPFQCGLCGRKFTQAGNRDRHEAKKVCQKKSECTF